MVAPLCCQGLPASQQCAWRRGRGAGAQLEAAGGRKGRWPHVWHLGFTPTPFEPHLPHRGRTEAEPALKPHNASALNVCFWCPQACRTEAEYAFQQRKKIVPVLMERDYKPSGW